MKFKTVTVDAVGRYEAVPDLATVKAFAVGQGQSVSDARTTVKDRTSAFRESITDVSTNRIRTVDIQVQDTDEMLDPIIDAPFQATEQLISIAFQKMSSRLLSI